MIDLKGKKEPKEQTGKKGQKTSKIYFNVGNDTPWYEIDVESLAKFQDLAHLPGAKDSHDLLMKQAEEIYASQCQAFQLVRKISDANREWFNSIVASGTLYDKASALSLAIQECPIYSLEYLNALLLMARKNNRRESVIAVENLKEVFYTSLLPSDRKLLFFHQRFPSSETLTSKRLLLLWYFEDRIKQCYFDFLKTVESLLQDQVPHTRSKMLILVWELLVDKPEQESSLLHLIINKLGDKDNKIASKASYLLLLISHRHPNMTLVLANEVRTFVEKPINISSLRMKYYALIFLNQITFIKGESDVADKLVEMYFELFNLMIVEPKIPTADSKSRKRIADSGDENENEKDEKSKIISAILTGLNRALPFSTFFKSSLSATMERYVDTLYKTVHGHNFNTTIQALNLLYSIVSSEMKGESDKITKFIDRFYRVLYEILIDSHLEGTSKQPQFINLLFRAMRTDDKFPRIKGFVKRILQSLVLHKPPYICGMLLMLNELIMGGGKLFRKRLFFADKSQIQEGGDNRDALIDGEYDGRKRDPLYCGAEKSGLHELHIFTRHFHPTVCKYALDLLEGREIQCSIDPFDKFTLSSFLDKFVYKNPKKLSDDGQEQERPKMTRIKHAQTDEPVNKRYSATDKQRNLAIDKIPEDELFFYKFFTLSYKGLKNGDKKKKAAASDKEGQDKELDEEFDQFIKSSTNDGDEDEHGDDGGYNEEDENDREYNEVDIDGEDDVDGLGEDAEHSESNIGNEESGDLDFFDRESDVEEEQSTKRRKKFKNLPIFADALEYLSD